MTSLPASDPGSAAVWGSKRINPRPQSCLCLTWSGYPSNDDDDDERNHNFKNDLANTEFLSRLAYLSDIFDTLNHMNMFFQGPNSNIADFFSKLQAYVRKLDLWTTNIEAKRYHMFKDLSSLQYQCSEKLFQEICCHLKLLTTELMHYFSNTDISPYVSNLFLVDPSVLSVGTGEQEQLLTSSLTKPLK